MYVTMFPHGVVPWNSVHARKQLYAVLSSSTDSGLDAGTSWELRRSFVNLVYVLKCRLQRAIRSWSNHGPRIVASRYSIRFWEPPASRTPSSTSSSSSRRGYPEISRVQRNWIAKH